LEYDELFSGVSIFKVGFSGLGVAGYGIGLAAAKPETCRLPRRMNMKIKMICLFIPTSPISNSLLPLIKVYYLLGWNRFVCGSLTVGTNYYRENQFQSCLDGL
jgi:hypothetical protein